MGFSTDLQDVFSHEALIGLQDAELRLLENMKKCVLLRAKCDRDYASSLTLVSGQAQKLEHFKELDGSYIARAWYAIIEETEMLSRLIRRNAENAATVTIEALNSLISEKRALKKIYIEEHDMLSKELHRLQGTVESTKAEYEKLLESWKDAKAKYEEQYIKGKGAKKVEEAKDRYQKVAKKLHVLHNDLVLLLCEATEYEKNFRSTLLPDLLYFQQVVMEDTAKTWKEILEEFFEFINITSEDFQAIHTRIRKNIEVIDAEDEYKEFVRKNRTEPLTAWEFKFEENMLKDFTGPLKANELLVDDFTHEFLVERKHELEVKLTKCEKDILKNQEDLKQYEDEIRFTHLVDFNSSSIKVKKRAADIVVKELGRLQCVEHTLSVQLHLIKLAMSCVSGDGLPQGLDLDDVSNEQKAEFNTLFTRRSKLIMEKLKQPFHSLKNKHVAATCPPSPPSKDFLEICNAGDEESTNLRKEVFDTSYQNEEWFHGVLPREEVVRLLVEEGDFLVRETTRNDVKQIVLSVCSHGYKHFIVHRTADGLFRFEGPGFRTITELIAYQFQSGAPVTLKSGAVLKRSVPRETWELNNDDVELIEKIGSGNFGDVYKALLHGHAENVAVKICHLNLPEAQKRKFLQEGRILKDYDHPNIVKFIGICVQKLPFMIVMELVTGGSLLNVLQTESDNLNINQLLSFCIDAAAGMEYLESRSCIHRDLAARNCLVDVNNTVKISDFGMSRESKEYVVTDGMKQIPIKWTAPEALNYGVYTCSSDVWSFGILMWEIFSFGGVPYLGLSNNKAAELVEGGYRLHSPDNTPPIVYKLMMQCWEYEPENRPHFNEIHSKLKVIVGNIKEDVIDL